MENNTENNEFVKIRTSRECLSEGIKMFTQNFRLINFDPIFISIVALLAILNAAVVLISTSESVSIYALGVVFLLMIILCALYTSFAVNHVSNRIDGVYTSKLSKSRVKDIFSHIGRFFLCGLIGWLPLVVLLAIMASGSAFLISRELSSETASIGWLIGGGVLAVFTVIVFFLLTPPLTVVGFHYMIGSKMFPRKKNSLGNAGMFGFKEGFRRWGRLFAVMFTASLFAFAVVFFATLPGELLFRAGNAMRESAALGENVCFPIGIKIFGCLFGIVSSYVVVVAYVCMTFAILMQYISICKLIKK